MKSDEESCKHWMMQKTVWLHVRITWSAFGLPDRPENYINKNLLQTWDKWWPPRSVIFENELIDDRKRAVLGCRLCIMPLRKPHAIYRKDNVPRWLCEQDLLFTVGDSVLREPRHKFQTATSRSLYELWPANNSIPRVINTVDHSRDPQSRDPLSGEPAIRSRSLIAPIARSRVRAEIPDRGAPLRGRRVALNICRRIKPFSVLPARRYYEAGIEIRPINA